mgnify:CR=1 FL=1
MQRDLNSIQIMMRSVRTLQRLEKDSDLVAEASYGYKQAAATLRIYAVEHLDKVLTANREYPRSLAHEIADRLR